MSGNVQRRLRILQEKMDDLNLDLIILSSCPNFQYYTGLLDNWRCDRGQAGGALNNLFIPHEGDPILTLSGDTARHSSRTWIKDVRIFTDFQLMMSGKGSEEIIEKILSDLDLKKPKIGLGNRVWTSTIVNIKRAIPDSEFSNIAAMADSLRKIKEADEIKNLRRVANLTTRVLKTIIPRIKEEVTQNQLELELEFEGKRLGASDISFTPTVGFVKSGSNVNADNYPYPDLSNPYTYSKDEGLEPGSSIAFDMGFVLNGYCSDFGRSFYLGTENGEIKKGYEALHQGILETTDQMYDESMRICDIFPTIEKTMDRMGYGKPFRTRQTMGIVGHNIGIEVHENPWLAPNYKEPIRAGMVIAFEPKIWEPGDYYLRVEDMILVGKNKAEILTNFNRDLFCI
jgi:Xaa-Pro aminopeptidase